MAKDSQSLLLQQVIDQLKQLNIASATDMLREAEALKRAEKLAQVSEVAADSSELMVSDNKDFMRRLIAGQAGALLNEENYAEPGRERARALQAKMNALLDSDQFQQRAQTEGIIAINFWTRNIYEFLVDNKATSEKTNEALNELLNHHRDRVNELNQQRNTDKRDETEAQHEAAKGAGGAGGRGVLNTSTGEVNDEGWEIGTSEAVIGGGILGMAITKMKKWFGFGTKFGFKNVWKLRIAALGAAMFPNAKFAKFVGPIKPTDAANPRKWGLLLAGIIAGTFLAYGTDILGDDEGELGDDVMPGENTTVIPPVLSSTIDTFFTTMAVAGLLSKAKWTKTISNRVSTKVKAQYKAAHAKNPRSMMGRMWASKGFQAGFKLTGRSLLRFMGPWGMAAWMAWSIAEMVIESNAQTAAVAEETLKEVENDITSGDIESIFDTPEITDALYVTKHTGPMNFQSSAIRAEMKARILRLMTGRSKDDQKRFKGELMALGWSSWDIDQIINRANGQVLPTSQYNWERKIRPGKDDGEIVVLDTSQKIGDTNYFVNQTTQYYDASGFNQEVHPMTGNAGVGKGGIAPFSWWVPLGEGVIK